MGIKAAKNFINEQPLYIAIGGPGSGFDLRDILNGMLDRLVEPEQTEKMRGDFREGDIVKYGGSLFGIITGIFSSLVAPYHVIIFPGQITNLNRLFCDAKCLEFIYRPIIFDKK